MLQAVVPPYGKRGSPKDWTRSPELSATWRSWRGARIGAGEGGLGPLRGVLEGGAGGFHKCDGEQGTGGVLMGF